MIGEAVRVYYNSHRKLFSIQKKSEGRWRLAFHTTDLCLKDAKFRVYEKARLRCIEKRTKGPHAYIEARIAEQFEIPLDGMLRIRYNPFVSGDFVSETGKVIRSANQVLLTKAGVFIND